MLQNAFSKVQQHIYIRTSLFTHFLHFNSFSISLYHSVFSFLLSIFLVMATILSNLEAYLQKANDELLQKTFHFKNKANISKVLSPSVTVGSYPVTIDLSERLGEILGRFLATYGNPIREFLGGKSLLHFETPLLILKQTDESFQLLLGARIYHHEARALLALLLFIFLLVISWKVVAYFLWNSCEEIIDLYSHLSPSELSVLEESSDVDSAFGSRSLVSQEDLYDTDQGSRKLFLKCFGKKDVRVVSPASSGATVVVEEMESTLLKSRPLGHAKKNHLFMVSKEYLMLLIPGIDSWLKQIPSNSSTSDIFLSLSRISNSLNNEAKPEFHPQDLHLLRFFLSTDYIGTNDGIKNRISSVTSQMTQNPRILIDSWESPTSDAGTSLEMMLLATAIAVFDVYSGFSLNLMNEILSSLMRLSRDNTIVSSFAADSFCVIMASSSENLYESLFNSVSQSTDNLGLPLLLRSLSFYVMVNKLHITSQLKTAPTTSKLQYPVIKLLMHSVPLFQKYPYHFQEIFHMGESITPLDEMVTLYNVVVDAFLNDEVPPPIQLELLELIVSKLYGILREKFKAGEICAPNIKGMGAN